MLSPQLLLQTRMDTLAKGSLAMCIIPHLADTPTSYVFSELLWVYMTVCGCRDWLGKRSKRSRHFQPVRGKTKANGNLLTRVFRRLVPGT